MAPTAENHESKRNKNISWKVRPAIPADKENVNKLLADSYGALLKNDYDAKLLEKALPLITRANDELLNCGTWYVIEDDNGLLAGCGGWTLKQPPKAKEGSAVPHLRHFATRSDMTRKGIGKAIWEQSWKDI